MPRLKSALPKYRHHKASGRAVVTLNGDEIYLGPYGSSISRQQYDRLIGEWLRSHDESISQSSSLATQSRGCKDLLVIGLSAASQGI